MRMSILFAMELMLGAIGSGLTENENTVYMNLTQQEDEWKIDWANLKNPILARDDACLKNPAVVYDNGYFYLFIHSWIYRTRDFKTYEEFQFFQGAVFGSPNIIKHNDTWYIVFQKNHPNIDSPLRLFCSTSKDLIHWTEPMHLVPNEKEPKEREIDGALAVADGHFILGYKADQKFYVTFSVENTVGGKWIEPKRASAGEGPWPLEEIVTWAEDFQFIKIDGKWRMIATGMLYGIPPIEYTWGHEPYIYEMKSSSPENLADWTEWVSKTRLEIPYEDWNIVMHANSAHLCDWRKYDGYFYLFYAGANDFWSFNRRGHGKIGVARSRDLVTWEVPGGIKENLIHRFVGNSIVLLFFGLLLISPAVALVLCGKLILVLTRKLRNKNDDVN